MTAASSPRATAIAGTGLALVAALLISAATFGAPGTELDEGTLVAYPTFTEDGEVPWADYESFYGPGEPYLVGGAFEVFGADVSTARAVGVAFRVALVVALFVILIPWGILAALCGGLISLLVALALVATAVPLADAIALALVALALLATAASRRARGLPTHASEIGAGVAGALALAFRPDLAPALLLGAAPFLVAAERASRLRALGGFAIGIVPTLVWMVAVGPDQLGAVLDDLIATQPGRRLPLPGPGSLEGQVLVASALAIIATLGGWLVARRRNGGELRAPTLLGLALFAIGLAPATVERADVAHLLFLGAVAIAPLPAVAVELWRARDSLPADRLAVAAAGLASVAALAGVVAVVHASGPTLIDSVTRTGSEGYEVEVGDRSFPIADAEAAADLNAVLARLDAVAEPGDSLFVGTDDLTRSNYNDVFVYYLFPELTHASPYTEFNPQTANAADSGLADQLESADFIVQTSRYDDWDEANASDERGPTAPDEVVDRDFEPVATHGTYELLEHRDG